MDELTKKRLDEFIDDFLNVEEVKQYFIFKDKLIRDERYASLKKELIKSQKALALSVGKSDYEDNKRHYYEIKKELDEYPLLVNYLYLEGEVKNLIQELVENVKL